MLELLYPELYDKQKLRNIKAYRYNAVDNSYLSKLLTPYWYWVTELMPQWLAPNAITVIGIVPMLACCVAAIVLSDGMKVPIPSWLCFAIFFQQTMDAVDGKQARRTKSGSVAGEFLDHGCDALFACCNFVVLSTAIMRRGSKSIFFVLWYFFCARFLPAWEKYYTGRFFLGTVNGAVDGFFFLMLLGVIAGWKGPEVYLMKISDSLNLGDAVCILGSLPGLTELFYAHSKSVIGASPSKGKFIRLLSIYPAILSLICMFLWISSPYSKVVWEYHFFVFIAVALLSGRLELALGVAHILKTSYPHKRVSLFVLPLVLQSIMASIPRVFPSFGSAFYALEPYFIVTWCLASAIEFLLYLTAIMDSFCSHLKIRPFSLQK